MTYVRVKGNDTTKLDNQSLLCVMCLMQLGTYAGGSRLNSKKLDSD